jgi:hypothetical protein
MKSVFQVICNCVDGQGVEGKYIRLQPLKDKPNKHDIIVDKSGDELLYTLAARITALCPYFSQIIHFIDTIDNGLVNQSLVAAMRAQIKDFFTLISQLETQHRKSDLTLQKMWYYLQPSFTHLAILKDIASKVSKVCIFKIIFDYFLKNAFICRANQLVVQFSVFFTKIPYH